MCVGEPGEHVFDGGVVDSLPQQPVHGLGLRGGGRPWGQVQRVQVPGCDPCTLKDARKPSHLGEAGILQDHRLACLSQGLSELADGWIKNSAAGQAPLQLLVEHGTPKELLLGHGNGREGTREREGPCNWRALLFNSPQGAWHRFRPALAHRFPTGFT